MKDTLKNLNSKKEEIEIALNQVKSSISEFEKRKTSLMEEKSKLEKRINLLKKGGVVITEHAMLRFCERVLGLDIEQVKKDLLPEKYREAVEKLGDGKFPIETWKVVVKNGVILTIEI